MGKGYTVWHLWWDKSYPVKTKIAEEDARQLADQLHKLSFQGKIMPEAKYSNAFMALRSGSDADLTCKGREVSDSPVDYQKILQETD